MIRRYFYKTNLMIHHAKLQKNLIFNVVSRTYNLKAETKEEALSWYTALRNKQVCFIFCS